MNHEETARRLRMALDMNNMRAIDLAEKTGILKSSISQYTSGRQAPGKNSAKLMAKALHVSDAWLLGLDVEMNGDSVPTVPKFEQSHIELINLFSQMSEESKQMTLNFMRSLVYKDR